MITFSKSSYDTNGTSKTSGQIAGLLINAKSWTWIRNYYEYKLTAKTERSLKIDAFTANRFIKNSISISYSKVITIK